MAERLIAPACKAGSQKTRRFESFRLHQYMRVKRACVPGWLCPRITRRLHAANAACNGSLTIARRGVSWTCRATNSQEETLARWSSWSYSSPCHGEDQGFESPTGRQMKLEAWLSGLRHLTRKQWVGESRHVGSTPTASARAKNRLEICERGLIAPIGNRMDRSNAVTKGSTPLVSARTSTPKKCGISK